ATTPIQWLWAHLNEPAPAMSEIMRLPPALSELVARMLAKKREERPRDMGEVMRELAVLRDGFEGRGAPAPRSTLHAVDGGVRQMASAIAQQRTQGSTLAGPLAAKAPAGPSS